MTRDWKNAWTGGQYSLVRTLAAGTLAVSLAGSAFERAELAALNVFLAVLAIGVASGFGIAGRLMAAILAVAVGMGAGAGLSFAARQFASLWLSAHVLLPKSPYGSFAARGRTDPGGGWSMPAWYPAFALALFVASRLFNAAHAYHDGSLLFAAAFAFAASLSLFEKTGLAGWLLSLVAGLALAAGSHSAADNPMSGSFSAVWLLHLVTFQPLWVPPRSSRAAPVVFYDGTCALCHNTVRFVLAEDTASRLRVAPLGGDTFMNELDAAERATLPDSVVVKRDGEILVRSAGVVAILETLGGVWRLIGLALRIVPTALLDRAYDFVASHRYRWFGRRADACPLLPPSLRTRIQH